MKTVVALSALSLISSIAHARDLTGQVFIVTEGGESIKLGLVEVRA